jgi:hypothetical protein
VSDIPVYVAAAVVAVRALWDRSGLLAGPVIREQLSHFAQALLMRMLRASTQPRSSSETGRTAGTMSSGLAGCSPSDMRA